MAYIKGTLLGFGILVVSMIGYSLLRLAYQFHKVSQMARSGTTVSAGGNWDIRGLIHEPYLWIAFVVCVALGIWIVKR